MQLREATTLEDRAPLTSPRRGEIRIARHTLRLSEVTLDEVVIPDGVIDGLRSGATYLVAYNPQPGIFLAAQDYRLFEPGSYFIGMVDVN